MYSPEYSKVDKEGRHHFSDATLFDHSRDHKQQLGHSKTMTIQYIGEAC